MTTSKRLRFPRGLYGVTPEWEDTDRLLQAISAAAQGGMVALQWRRKTSSPAERRRQLEKVAAQCKTLAIPLIVNDDWRLALEVDAEGVHMGREDGDPSEARLALGPSRLIGCSCYNQSSLAAQALAADVDYIAFGAMYPSSVKPEAVSAGLEDIEHGRMLAESRAKDRRAAVVAIGGITIENAAPLIHAGADSVAVISGLFDTPDIRSTASRFRDCFAGLSFVSP
jgi:thiamine-phosphate pyrophosphorylase